MARSEAPLRLLDVNVLIALSLPNHVHHGLVSRWFDGVARWATCSITQSAYIRLLLNPKVTGFPVAGLVRGSRSCAGSRGTSSWQTTHPWRSPSST